MYPFPCFTSACGLCGLELSSSGPLVICNSKVWSFCVWSGQDRLLAGAIIAERIRSAVRMELGYTCSVVDMLHSLAFPLTCVEACLVLSFLFLFSILVWLWVLMGWQGIATNKLLAKIASAKNKPDRQTLVGCSFLWSQIQHLSFPTILCAACLNPMWHLQISPVSWSGKYLFKCFICNVVVSL